MAYSATSSYDNKYTFFMVDNIKDQILSIENEIPELFNDDYYYLISTSFYNNFTRLIFFPKNCISYIYGDIKNNDSIWAITNASGNCIVYSFGHNSKNLNNHTLELNLSFNKFEADYSVFKSYSPDDIVFTYNPNDNYFWAIGNIPIYVDAERQALWLEPVDNFFLKAPVTGTLAPILERVEMMEPIVTTISGTLKLLIPFLVSLIAFWKAWQVFSRVLHHA